MDPGSPCINTVYAAPNHVLPRWISIAEAAGARSCTQAATLVDRNAVTAGSVVECVGANLIR
jgi:hypothetical protein